MTLSLSQLQDYINYCAIHKDWKSLEILLSRSMANFEENEMCIFWNGFCCLKRGETNEARNFLKQIDTNSDYNLASFCALIETYLMRQNDDDEEYDASKIAKLKSNIKKLSKTDHVSRLMHAATYFWHINRIKQARHYAEKALNLNKENANSLAITGWIYLSETATKYIKKAPSYFAGALSIAQKQRTATKSQELALLPLYGLSRCYQLRGKIAKAIDCITQLIVHNGWFTDGLAIKSEFKLLLGQHQQCIDTVNRLLSTENHERNMHALVIKLCYLLMFNGNYTKIVDHMQFVYSTLVEEYKVNKYPSYAFLFYNLANITSRFVIDCTEILEICQQFISIAVELEPENSKYLTLQANLYLYLGYIETALQLFRDASAFDDNENNMEALCGAIYCRVLKGEIKDAHQEIQFLTETTDVKQSKTFLKFLQAVVAWHRNRDEEEFKFYIKAALDEYASNIQSHRFSQYTDLTRHNPRFCVLIVNEYLKHSPSEPLSSTDPPSYYLNESKYILHELCTRVPGMMDAKLLDAKCRYLEGDIYGSESILHKLKDTDANYWRAHLLQCQVALYAKSYNEAQTCLDSVIVLNFEIQTTLIYHIVKSKLLQSNALYADAIDLLQNAIDKIYSYTDYKNKLLDNKTANNTIHTLAQKRCVLFSRYEEKMDEEQFITLCINIIVQLSQIYKITNEINKAKELMNNARNVFKGQNEMILIRLSEVRMLLKQNEIDSALAILHCVSSSSLYYRRSKLLIADIYLKHKRNKKMYIQCFEELNKQNPNDIHCLLLLADALMNIQKTSEAIHCYERALIISDYDEKLALKFGRALITSHDYQRAILHFEATLANNTECSVDLKTELAELYIQFEQYAKAKSILKESLSENSETFRDLQANVKMLCLFADLYQNVERWKDAKSLLAEAWNFQQKLTSMANAAGKDMKSIEMTTTNICYNLGFVSLRLDDVSTAETYLNKALESDIQHEKATMEIAKLYEMKGNYDSAKDKLKSVLSMNQNNEDAVVFLVNICVDHKDLKMALTELRLFRGSNALNINILLLQMKLLKRSGEYQKIKELLKETEIIINDPSKVSIYADNDYFNSISVGVYYVRGYVLWYIDNNAESAINELNKIRNDIHWGPRALTLMIKIYLFINPAFTFLDVMSTYCHPERHQQLEVCQVLLKELKHFNPGHDATLLTIGCLLLMASGNEDALDKAHTTLNAICKRHTKHILSHMAYGCSLYLKELQNKAIQFLNRFILDNKKEIIFEGHLHFDEYEELLLVLLQLQLNSMMDNNEDVAGINAKEEIQIVQKMCLDLLKHDASCSKAWQIVARASEKQNNFAQAAKHYGTAWFLQNKRNGLLGYNYARSLFKISEYIQCIHVAHKVLDEDKNFTQIQSIIDHALSELRS